MMDPTAIETVESSVLQKVTGPSLIKHGLISAYDNWASTYDEDMVGRLGYMAYTKTADIFCEWFEPSRRSVVRVLDIGAGTGLIGQQLKERGFTNIDALDPSAKMLEEARKKNVYKHLYCELLTSKELSISKGSYDVVVGVGMLGPNYAPFSAMNEMVRLTKQGGHVVLCIRQELIHRSDFKELIPTMKSIEEIGIWQKVDERVIENYWNGSDGVLYIFEVL